METKRYVKIRIKKKNISTFRDSTGREIEVLKDFRSGREELGLGKTKAKISLRGRT